MSNRRYSPTMCESDRQIVLDKLAEHSTHLSNGCVIWTGTNNTHGYPVTHLFGEREFVRRIVYDMHHIQEAGDATVKPICKNVSCISPAHLIKTDSPKGGKGRKSYGHTKYPWREWFRKSKITLTKGKEYQCSTTSFIQLMRNAARQYQCSISIENKDTHVNVAISHEEK